MKKKISKIRRKEQHPLRATFNKVSNWKTSGHDEIDGIGLKLDDILS